MIWWLLKLVPMVVVVIVSLVLYGELPATMAVHFNVWGQADGWMSKGVGVWMVPLVMVISLVVLEWVKRTDPKRVRQWTMEAMVAGLVWFLALLQLMVLLVNIGAAVDVARVMVVLMAVGLVGVGRLVEKTKRNYWMGFRTPWTLESEKVWRKTNLWGGRVFAGVGLATLVGLINPAWGFGVLMAGLVGGSVVMVGLSYWWYRGEKR